MIRPATRRNLFASTLTLLLLAAAIIAAPARAPDRAADGIAAGGFISDQSCLSSVGPS
jgi:hypothetical protein